MNQVPERARTPKPGTSFARALKRTNDILLAIFYVAFGVLIAAELATGSLWFWPCLITSAVAFAAVSVFRDVYNAPRPYEVTGRAPAFPKETKGHSFPSRHVFSAFMIAFDWVAFCWPVGFVLLCAAAVVAWVRWRAGVHFLRDVIAGFVAAAIAAALGLWLVPAVCGIA